jgi:serine phosphatase RsbU (regulator of sigma subunit)
MSRLKKLLLVSASAVCFVAHVILDVVLSAVDLGFGWIAFLQTGILVAGFLLMYFFIRSQWRRDQGPVRKLGLALVLSLIVGWSWLVLALTSGAVYDVKGDNLIPQNFETIVTANLYGVAGGLMAILILLILRDVILARRRKGTRRNFLVYLGTLAVAIGITLPYAPLETDVWTVGAFVLVILAAVVNSFRLSWIVYLTKREKLITMAFSFVLFAMYVVFYVFSAEQNSALSQGLRYFSRQAEVFISGSELFAAIYFGMTFISTLFHLPTAEAFDRKAIEVHSLHDLGKLVTRVFDFNELTDLVTKLTTQVCEARSAWLEMAAEGLPAGPGDPTIPVMRVAAARNIAPEEAETVAAMSFDGLRAMAVRERKPVVIDRIGEDPRTKALKGLLKGHESMAVVPLLSHDQVIGILYATKEMEFGFDREDVDAISSFADQATIAIENSKLIEKSLERERLMREMLLAQEMQRKLLPQNLPSVPGLEIEALSTPAFEVGGDYYDCAMLDEEHLAIIVGDVSGKGVSAALYMAEMKGIFQSLSAHHSSPAEFLAKAHAALYGTMDKRTFISLLYAILNVRTGVMKIARAGHCPLIVRSSGGVKFHKPVGLAVGMGSREYFAGKIADQQLELRPGDSAVFYTDGITEARRDGGDEFGYERLEEVVRRSTGRSAIDLRDEIVKAVDVHMGHEPPADDLTLVVLRWENNSTISERNQRNERNQA